VVTNLKDILYLLVVNMPTEKEMAEARTAIEAARHS
jgi:hypothetical protein